MQCMLCVCVCGGGLGLGFFWGQSLLTVFHFLVLKHPNLNMILVPRGPSTAVSCNIVITNTITLYDAVQRV